MLVRSVNPRPAGHKNRATPAALYDPCGRNQINALSVSSSPQAGHSKPRFKSVYRPDHSQPPNSLSQTTSSAETAPNDCPSGEVKGAEYAALKLSSTSSSQTRNFSSFASFGIDTISRGLTLTITILSP